MMLTITFKNVGHGDTIILEWQNDRGKDEIGIVDCNIENCLYGAAEDSNAVIEHIKTRNYKKIHFMVLSHPHTDHFSGFISLLEFCQKNGIKIERFWHTATYNTIFMGEMLNKMAPVNRKKDKYWLKKLFREIHGLHGSNILGEAGLANSTSSMDLNKKLRIEFLAPSGYDELEKYLNKAFQLNPEEELELRRRNNPAANLLSSVILITSGTWNVLLTSDSTDFTIRRLYHSCFDRLNRRLLFVQIPHHGSQDSHFDDFWNKFPNKKEIPVLISAGGKYGLPSKEIIAFFDKNYKEIHSTNFAGGLIEYFGHPYHKEGELKNQDVDSPFYVYDRHFLERHTESEDRHKEFLCGEKQIKIEEDGSFKIETKPTKN
jgi:competence protein ComEC